MNATCTTISGRTQCARSRGRPVAFVNGDVGTSMRVEPRSQIQQELCVEAGADLPGKHEIAAFVVADEQRAQADARALRIGEPAHDELLRRLALHLQPVLRAAMLVRRASPLGDHAFPALAPGALPRFLVVEQLDAPHRALERQLLQERPSLFERQGGHDPSVQPQDVEDVIAAAAVPGHFAVENHVIDGKIGDGARRPPADSAAAGCANTTAHRRRVCRRAA